MKHLTTRDAASRGRLAAYLKERRQAIDPQVAVLGALQRSPDRIGRPVTQQELADAIGVSRTWYALLEEGGANASPSLLLRLGECFLLDPDDRLHLFTLAIPEIESLVNAAALPPDLSRYTIPISPADHVDLAEQRMTRLRAEFFRGALSSTDGIRPRILQSWIRCREANVDAHRSRLLPLPPGVTASGLRQASAQLLYAATPVMDALADRLAEHGRFVTLTDGDAMLIRTLTDSDSLASTFDDPDNICADLSERAVGTGAVATSIVDGRPLQVMGAEHYSDAWLEIAASAAPIRSPATGKIVGILCIAGSHRTIRPQHLAITVQSAVEIEERLAVNGLVA